MPEKPMPVRITAADLHGEDLWWSTKDEECPDNGSAEYIRADLVDALVEAGNALQSPSCNGRLCTAWREAVSKAGA